MLGSGNPFLVPGLFSCARVALPINKGASKQKGHTMTPPKRSPWPRVYVAILASAAAMFTATPSAQAQQLVLPEIQTWELNNGLKVAFMKVDSAPVVAVELWYHVGSKDEARDRRGSAHMFEHMMFKGTKNVRPEQHARHVNKIGGYVNAATSEDATWYINVVPNDYLDFACQLEAERMRGLLFRDGMIATEREVVKEEIRQQENRPLAKGFLRFLEIAYTKHPYAWTSGGTIADLDATKSADLQAFYNTYYVPNNAMLVVVGDVTREQVESAAKTWFEPIARGAEPPRPADKAPEPLQTTMRREVVQSGHVGIVLAGYHIPGARHADIYPVQIASLLLGAGESSRLHRRAVLKDRTALQTASPILVREHPGLLAVLGAYLNPAHGDQLEAALIDEVTRLGNANISNKELAKAKNQMKSSFVMGLEGVAGIAQQIGTSWVTSGDPGHWLQTLKKYEAVTVADVKRVVTTYLKKANATVVVIPPKGATNAPSK